MKTTVVHVNSAEWQQAKAEGRAVYIGRACRRAKDPLCHVRSKWANPFHVGFRGCGIRIDTREAAILMFRKWMVGNSFAIGLACCMPPMRCDLADLRGKVLGCWCKPQACHGDVLVELLEAK